MVLLSKEQDVDRKRISFSKIIIASFPENDTNGMWQISMIANKIYKIKHSILSDFDDKIIDSFPIIFKIFASINFPKRSRQVIPMKE